jgi:hypothetical protein
MIDVTPISSVLNRSDQASWKRQGNMTTLERELRNQFVINP